jgi:hypothetical protein
MFFNFVKNGAEKKAEHLDNVKIMLSNQIEYQRYVNEHHPESKIETGILIGLTIAKRYLDLL